MRRDSWRLTYSPSTAYKASLDLEKEYKDAEAMFRRSIIAIDHVSSALEFVVL